MTARYHETLVDRGTVAYHDPSHNILVMAGGEARGVEVAYCTEAEAELATLPPRERAALLAAVAKLEALGDRLPSPHSSAARGVEATLRELRPRAGRSPWRAFYRRVGDRMVIGAIGPEAAVDRAGFRRAVADALERLAAIEAEEDDDG